MGAEMTEDIGPRRPCEIVPTEMGDRGEGASLSYGTERSSRSSPDSEGWRDLYVLLFLPKILSIVTE
jgi:hypothetical protein